MPYKDPEKAREYWKLRKRKLYKENPEKYRKLHKEYYQKNKKKCRKMAREWQNNHKQLIKERGFQVRMEVLRHYSNGTMKCNCCGESNPKFLTLDHINGGGNLTPSGLVLARWLRKRNYPENYQVLCFNCNQAKYIYGRCPHGQP